MQPKVEAEMKLSSNLSAQTETNIEVGIVKEHMKVLYILSRKSYSGKQPRLTIIETAHKNKDS